MHREANNFSNAFIADVFLTPNMPNSEMDEDERPQNQPPSDSRAARNSQYDWHIKALEAEVEVQKPRQKLKSRRPRLKPRRLEMKRSKPRWKWTS